MYVNHLFTLASDRQTKAEDKACLKGYVFKMKNYKMLVGTAMYVDLLQPIHFLSFSLQDDKVNIAHGIHNLLKASKSLKGLAKKEPKLVLSRLQRDKEDTLYQSPFGKLFYQHTKVTVQKGEHYLVCLDNKMKERLGWCDTKLLCHIIAFLDTQTRQESVTFKPLSKILKTRMLMILQRLEKL